MPALNARRLFGIAALFNFGVGGALLLARPLVTALLRFDAVTGTNLMTFYLAAGLITLFGYAYLLVARDPVRYRPYISLGLLGKLIAIVIAVSTWLGGYAPATVPELAIGDVIFVGLFIRYLLQAETRVDQS
jgi:hypothetical protein